MARIRSGLLGGRAEDITEGLLILFNRCDLRHRSIQVGLTHLNRIDNCNAACSSRVFTRPVPELRLIVEGVQNGRCVALAGAALMPTEVGFLSVRRAQDHGMCARDGTRQPTDDGRTQVSGPGKFSQGSADCPSGLRHDSSQLARQLVEATSAALTDPFLELVVTARSF